MFGKHSFDLEKQFVFYASYHNSPINVAIHILCIWPILATGLVLFQYTPEFMAAPELFNQLPSGEFFKVNLALLVTVIYMVCYVIMEPFAGTLGAILVSMLYVHSAKMVGIGAMVAGIPIWKVALAIHVAAWILQFIGHGVFEGMNNIMLDLVQLTFLK
eukprot:00566.XXX_989_1522_1 [CDS] Oithona nana genome sequencing.